MSVLAQRYASSLADVALERKDAEKLRGELREFVSMFRESAELRNFLESPAIARPAKQAAITKLAQRMGARAEVRNFLLVIVENRRTALLGEIYQAFEIELKRRLGIVEADVTSARELAAEEKAELNRALERLTGKRIETRYAVDGGLIGGARVRVGSTIYDGSVRQQLEKLRAQLEAE